MKLNLTTRLIAIMGCGIVLAFVGQVLTRQLFEVPSLMALETYADNKDIERVRLAFLSLTDTLTASTLDHGTWDDTYEAVTLNPGNPVFDKFVEANLVSSTYESLMVDGGLFMDTNGRVKHNSHVEKIGNVFGPDRYLFPSSLELDLAIQTDAPVITRLIGAGVSHSNLGPIMYAASHIVTTNPPYPRSRGIWVFWRLMDKELFDVVTKNVQIKIDFIPIDEAARRPDLSSILDRLYSGNGNHLPRDENGLLHWILRDANKHPIFLARQFADKRAFNEELLSTSVIIGFTSSALILIFLAVFFSQTVIRRLLNARATMLEILKTGDYDRRLPSYDKDEIDTLFKQFNQLLEHIQQQNQELVSQNLELSELSEQDALTGISNRRFLDETLERSWRQCARSGKEMSVLMIDVDYFKAFNDEYGHPAGDQVLKQVAKCLKANLHRGNDYLARYGGEEFCVVLIDTDATSALSVAERLRSEIQELRIRSDVSKCADVVTISIGVATVSPGSKVIEFSLVEAADRALYQAKNMGRNRVHLYDKQDNVIPAKRGEVQGQG